MGGSDQLSQVENGLTREDILQALRLTAMGRAGHPLQEQLAEKLAESFERIFAKGAGLAEARVYTDEGPVDVALTAETVATVAAKRRKKAE